MKPLCLDSNVFIASIKEDETYSEECKKIVETISKGEYYLVEPSICITEVVGNVAKYLGVEYGKAQETVLKNLVSIWELCDEAFCSQAAYTAAKYKIYSMDALFLESALKHSATLVSLDEKDFLLRIKDIASIKVFHPKDFLI